MGQYFRPVNTDKKEYICPWCIGGSVKLWEWAANREGSIFTLLLRKSTEGGGGDFQGQVAEYSNAAIAGRWAMDRVALVGDYDDSGLYDPPPEYRDISRELVETWNEFIQIDERKLQYIPCVTCKRSQHARDGSATPSVGVKTKATGRERHLVLPGTG